MDSGHSFVQGPDNMESEDLSVQKESVVDENRKVFGSQDEDFTRGQFDVDGSDHTNMNIIEGNEELAHGNSVDFVKSAGDENQASHGLVEMNIDQENHFTAPEFHMEEFGSMRQLELDKELCVDEVCEAMDSFLDQDIVSVSSKPIENNDRKRSPLEKKVAEEVECEMQLNEIELGKLVSASCAMNYSLHLPSNEEIEEGEISGDVGVYDESMDFLPEEALLLKEKKSEEVQISEDIIDKENSTSDEQKRGLERDTNSNPSFMETIENAGNIMDKELRGGIINEVKDKSEMVFHRKSVEAKEVDGYDSLIEAGGIKKQGGEVKEPDHSAACPENLSSGKILGETTNDNQFTASTEKDADACKKEKKRGPLTKERRAKKKQKERIKRAEKNRKLGVKRLKLQPVLKPKIVTYCRHYLKGRCQEGEKCKFSHDTVPLTKSKPCCHFARHSCMKGDDCPFDHQLSKYPCNNFLSKGSCSRGADCLFSHKMLVKEGSPITSNVSKHELSSESTLGNLNSKKQLNVHGTSHQNVGIKSCSIGISPCKSTEQHVVEPIPKPASQAPKGVSFLLHGRSSLGVGSKQKQAGSSPKTVDGVKVGYQIIHSASDVVQISNENIKRTPGVAPKGTNSLSFGKAPLDDSNSKKSFSMLFNRDSGNERSLLGNSSKGNQASSSSKGDSVVKGGSDMVPNLNEMTNKTPPAVVPRGINFLSFGKASSLDDSTNKKQASLHSNVDKVVPSPVEENQYTPDKLKRPSVAMPWRLTSSSLPHVQSLDRSADGHSKDMPSSYQMSHLSNSPSSVQKALRSTLAFAAKFESEIKMDRPICAPAVSTDFNKGAGNSQNKLLKASTILDFLYGDSSKTKK